MNCKNCGYGLKQSCGDFEKIICTYEEGECVKITELNSKMSDRLAKAEELLLELYDCIPSSMADSCKETLQKVALFFKDSEVEK